MTTEISRLAVSLVGDISDIKKTFGQAGDAAKGFQNKTQALSKKMSSTGMSLTKNLTLPLAGLAAGVGVATNSAVKFEGSMNEVFTLLPQLSAAAKDQMSEDLLTFSDKMGITTEEAIPALYQAISAGVPPGNVFAFMETAGKAAIGGVTDLETSVDGITSVVNAYGKEIIATDQAADQMFAAVKLGKTDFESLSSSLFQVIPSAAAMNIKFGDIAAGLATITAQGTPTRVTTTQMRQLFVELSKAGGETALTFEAMAGKSFKQFIAEGGNVQEALQIMEKGAEDSGVGINDLFSSVEAGNAALQLTSKEGTVIFSKGLEEMKTSAGNVDEAFKTMESGSGRSMKKFGVAFGNIMTEIGQEFLPILTDDLLPILKDTIMPLIKDVLLPLFKGVMKFFKDQNPIIRTLIILLGGFAAVLGPLLLVLAPVVASIGSLVGTIGAAGGLTAVMAPLILTLGAVAGPIIGIGLAIAGLILIGKLLIDHWDEISGFVSEVWDGIVGFAGDAIEGLKIIWSWTPLGMITGHWEEITVTLTKVWDGIKDLSKGAIGFLKIIWSWTPIGMITTHWKVILGFVKKGIGAAAKLFADFSTGIKNIFKGISDFIFGIFDGIVRSIKSTLNSIIGAINILIRGMNLLKWDVPDWVPFIGGNKFGINVPPIPMLASGGIIDKAGSAIVGERGAELITLPKGAQVSPLPQSSGNTYNFRGLFDGAQVNMRNEQDIELLSKKMFALIERKNRGRGTR